MPFKDREEAAHELLGDLGQYKGQNPLVLAIPRGSVPMGKIIADALGGDLDVVLVRKLRAPYQPELAIGAIAENGWSQVEDYASSTGATHPYIAAEMKTQMETIQRRREAYSHIRPPLDPADRIVIVVDDGLATGATMLAALHAIRARHPRELVVAVPVASKEALERIRPYADKVICPVPEMRLAISQYYLSFPQIEDRQVAEVLQEAAAQQSHRGTAEMTGKSDG